MTWVLSHLSIQGVKGVLDRAGDFQLKPRKGAHRSIAIFGRNGHGKSGYADAVEYLFSSDGEVEHLGKGGADSELGGKHAIPHVLATERGIAPQIVAEFTQIETNKKITATRPVVTGRIDPRPAEVDAVIAQSPAHRILRQHDLRRFVVEMTPGEKFAEFARWIGLESSANLLKHLTTVERTLKDTDVDREVSERLKSIESHTNGAVTSYDLTAILKWCEGEVAKHIGKVLSIQGPTDIENGVQALRTQRETVVIQSQAAQAYLIRGSLEKASLTLADNKGPVLLLRTSLENALIAERAKDDAQNKAVQSVFQEVWESAHKLLEEHKPDICPVCQTPWANTVAASPENALVVLKSSIVTLSQLKAANNSYLQQRQNLRNALQRLELSLSEIDGFARTLSLPQILESTTKLKSTCTGLKQEKGMVRDLEAQFIDFTDKCIELATKSVPQALLEKTPGSPSTTSLDIDQSIAHLQGIREAILRLEALRLQLVAIRTVENQFAKVVERIRSETKAVAENAVNSLRDDVRRIYKKIHPGEAVPDIFIKLDTDEKSLTIRVNFHSNDRTVPPGGYLSEAQINTLGLALFLSSVRLFNKDFPFVFFDDIVSSYDADSRARIVDVLAEDMNDFQIFLTTHDERFYTHLKGRLESENWLFEKISDYEFEKGPKRESDNLRPEQIDELIKHGNESNAGIAVRQYMENWFDNVCERLYVYTLHRRGSKDYKRTLFDYWTPFTKKIGGLKGEAGKHILSSEAYKRFEGGLFPIINYYSHNQTNPYEWASIGDVKYIWEAFKDFSKLLCCNSCGKLLQCHFEEQKLYCTCGSAILPMP